ncbi:MAG: O-antigen ligase family protein [Bacteroidetes bacterium]|nr:O-antigen ligase family protein [Bacteroidota bacterium]
MPLALARLTFRYSTVFFPSAPSANIYKYFVSKELLDFEKQKKTLYDQRREKWAYSIELFNAFPRTQKIWGEGFHYLKQFEEKFQKEEKVQDYPHNYLLSALLYSGLLGMVVFVIYLILCGLLYLKHIKKISVLFWIFLITQVFAFTSGNSIFTEKLSCFLLVVPFLIEKVFAESKETVKISKS